jgi:phosphate:Na+ symporter
MFIYVAKFLSGVGIFLFALILLNNCISGYKNSFNSTFLKSLNNCYYDCIAGFIAAAITQSSSAINGILVNLSDQKVLQRKNSYFIVMGCNVGTTISAYLAILGKIDSANFIICTLFVCSLIYMIFNNQKMKNISYFLCVFSMIFVGLSMVNDSSPFLLSKLDINLLKNSNSYALFIIAVLIAAICQSSTLISVLIVTMSGYGLLSLEGAMFMIMGTNLGTCSTALLVAIGKSKEGLSVAMFNLFFNLIGIILNIFLYYSYLLIPFTQLNIPLDIKVALYHTLFNVTTTLIVFPLIKYFDHIKFGNKYILFYE